MADESLTRYVTWDAHNEFAKRMDDTNERQEVRISALERGLMEVNKITLSVERLATNMESFSKELSKQGERLERIEEKPTKRWDAVITGVIGAIVGALGAALMSGLIK